MARTRVIHASVGTKEDEAEFKQLAEAGFNRIEIAQRLNRSIGATEVRASKLGISITTTASLTRQSSQMPSNPGTSPRTGLETGTPENFAIKPAGTIGRALDESDS